VIGGGSTPGTADGRERERIGRIVSELDLEHMTRFPGQLGPDNLHLYYAAADVTVVPSHYEPFGLVAIEAMASGCPVVASGVGGLKYTVVDQVTGLLAPPRCVQGFAKALDRLLADQELRRELGAAGSRRVRTHFTWTRAADNCTRIYLDLAGC